MINTFNTNIMAKFSSFLLTMILVILYLGVYALFIYVAVFLAIIILYKLKPDWFLLK